MLGEKKKIECKYQIYKQDKTWKTVTTLLHNNMYTITIYADNIIPIILLNL